ncbi:MAG: hypothetical protein FJ091_08835 [Deltaproteobacteria bacterium]|nr:hypothetical protein [Deltaproteobacteria bacterium]
MQTALRWLSRILGAFFLVEGVSWLANPAGAAQGLAMPLLDGLGRSTQVGDFAAFFLAIGATALAGARAGHARLLFVPAGILAAAALGRTLAWALHGADFASVFIGVEVMAAAILAFAATRLDASA